MPARIPALVMFIAALATVMHPSALPAQTMGLQLVDRDETITRLRVTNAQVPNVNLQGSFDLEHWFHMQSAVPVLGVASFTHTNDEPIAAWYFRTVGAPAPLRINVGPRLDTNLVVSALIFPESGGNLELSDANGVFYQLSIRSNLVTTPTLVRMTVITNFTGMPLTNRFRAAVEFEPEGLEFRAPAELTIRFPGPIPNLEMVGYGFQASGDDFHLRPWETSGNEVTLPVTHFSGAGVSAEPFTATGADRYGQGLAYTRDAIREADQWLGNQYREIHRNRSEDKITREEAQSQRDLVRKQRNLRVYLNAIQPLLSAATRDCEVGLVVLRRLDQLAGNSAVYGEGIFYPEILRIGPAIRCECARYYLELCERDAISGIIATDELRNVLDFVALNTGLIEDPNCALGSDFDILARLAKGKCHKPWEGTVRYSSSFRSSSVATFSSDASLTRTDQDEFSYYGRIIELVEEDGGPTANNGTWQTWTMRLAGKFSGLRYETQTLIDVTPNWTVTDTSVRKGAAAMPTGGDLIIRFENGVFASVSASAGLGTNRNNIPLTHTTELKVECRQPDCPRSIPASTTDSGTDSMYFGESPSVRTAGLTWEWQKNGSLKIVLRRNKSVVLRAPLVGNEETTQTLTVQVWRGSAD
jgi:hypothetical protein